MKIAQTKLVLCALLAGAMLAVAPAQADQYLFTEDHATGGLGQPPPFGTVTLVQNGTTVDITVDLADGLQYVKTGAGDFQNFKFNGVGVALADITVDAHTPALVAATGDFHGNGTGQFAFGINAPGQGNGGSGKFLNDIVFHVANATIADLTGANNLGFIFAADVISASGATGPIGVNTRPNSVPDGGSTVALLGLAFAGVGMLRRKLS